MQNVLNIFQASLLNMTAINVFLKVCSDMYLHNYKWIVTQFSNTSLGTISKSMDSNYVKISTSTDSDCIEFDRYNLKFLHYCYS
jgi:hypothetical protein